MIRLDIPWICSFPNRSKHFCARVLPGRWDPARAQRCFDRLGNDQIHGISNQMMHSIVGKGLKIFSIQSNDWFRAFGKVEKAFRTRICLLILNFDLLFELLSLYHVMCLYVYVCAYPESRPAGGFWAKYFISSDPRSHANVQSKATFW